MAEWSNAAVLKTVVPRGTGGSNPSSSAESSTSCRAFFVLADSTLSLFYTYYSTISWKPLYREVPGRFADAIRIPLPLHLDKGQYESADLFCCYTLWVWTGSKWSEAEFTRGCAACLWVWVIPLPLQTKPWQNCQGFFILGRAELVQGRITMKKELRYVMRRVLFETPPLGITAGNP